MTTTHKSLRGPRGAMIFFRKGVRSVDKKGKGKYLTMSSVHIQLWLVMTCLEIHISSLFIGCIFRNPL